MKFDGRTLSGAMLTLAVAFLLGPSWVPAQTPAASSPVRENLLDGAKWQYSTDDQKTWVDQPPTVRQGEAAVIYARTSFQVQDPSPFAVLEFTHGLPRHDDMQLRLNGSEVTSGLKGMIYRTYPAIPASLLKKGRNDLAVAVTFAKVPPPAEPGKTIPDVLVDLRTDLAALEPAHLAFVSGPVLGAAGRDYFTVTCRTNMPVPVTLKVRPAGESPGPVIERRSEPGLFHRFRADGLEAAKPWQYSLSVEAPPYRLVGKAYPVRLLPGGDRLRFVVFGDCRSRTKEWAAVAEAVRQSKPDLVVFTGDMTECGRHDWLWQEHFFGPAAELFATVPFYPVIGNHEENAPVYPLLFHTPSPDGLATDWAQEIAAVLIVGFDGQWSPTWDRQKKPWLRKVLADSPAKFIFVATHYPAYSSSGNGTLDPKTGQPRHWAYRNGREFVLPLLARHQAAAMITSHEHHYERSELPQGLTQIISGGAGAPLSGKVPQADKQNPYAKVFLQTLHYCLIEVQGHQARCRALTPEGKEIDLVTWKARAGR